MHSHFVAAILIAAGLFLGACSSDTRSRICFVGDSITHLWDVDYYFPEYFPANHGVNRAKIEDVFTWDLSDCKDIPTVIMIGTNNLNAVAKSDSLKAAFLGNYIKKYMELLEQIEASNYVVISILPRDREYNEKGALNPYIAVLNDSLERTLDHQKFNSTFVNAYPHFLKDSAIIREYYSDGLHLSEEGYDVLSSLVREVL